MTQDEFNKIHFCHLTQAYPTAAVFNNGIIPQHATKGAHDGTWYLEAAAAIAETPGRLEEVFAKGYVIQAKGAYAVNLFDLGIP